MYKKLYYSLFNSVTDAILMLRAGQREAAMKLLIQAQQDCEKRFILWEEDEQVPD